MQIDRHFGDVIRHCAIVKRKDQDATWITDEMLRAYRMLHQEGYAHSFETYCGDQLVGGLYGVSLGKTFFGESMFYLQTDASKISLYHLVILLKYLKFDMIDAQQSTSHLRSLGAEEIPRERFLKILSSSLQAPTIKGSWSGFAEVLQDTD